MPLAHRPTIGRPAANSPAMWAAALAKRTSAAQSAQAGAWISAAGQERPQAERQGGAARAQGDDRRARRHARRALAAGDDQREVGHLRLGHHRRAAGRAGPAGSRSRPARPPRSCRPRRAPPSPWPRWRPTFITTTRSHCCRMAARRSAADGGRDQRDRLVVEAQRQLGRGGGGGDRGDARDHLALEPVAQPRQQVGERAVEQAGRPRTGTRTSWPWLELADDAGHRAGRRRGRWPRRPGSSA